jgi:hypothetical protein
MKSLLPLALVLLASLAAPAQAANVTGRDPQAVRGLFDRWGFAPGAIQENEGVPWFETNIDGIGAAVGLGGCTGGRNCTYLTVSAIYSDVPNPPFEWLNDQNMLYDQVTALRSEAGLLSVRTAIMLGAEGVPEATLRVAIGDWAHANGEIAERAIRAGLAREQ